MSFQLGLYFFLQFCNEGIGMHEYSSSLQDLVFSESLKLSAYCKKLQ